MENQEQKNLHTVFSVITLIIGILSFIFCFVPCFGVYALWGGMAGIGCGSMGIYMAKKAHAGIGMAVAGIVISLLATLVALWQWHTLTGLNH